MPLNPIVVAMYVPSMIVHINGSSMSVQMNNINPINPIPKNISLNIIFYPINVVLVVLHFCMCL